MSNMDKAATAMNPRARAALAVGAAAGMLILFLAPLKFGVVEILQTATVVKPPQGLIEWLVMTWPNTFAFKPLLAIGLLCGVAIIGGLNPARKAWSVVAAGFGWALLMMGIAWADKKMLQGGVSEWANNPIKIQFLLYGAWYFASALFLARRKFREAAAIALIAAGVFVCIEAVNQYRGGLDDMRMEAARQAGFTNQVGEVAYSDFTNSLAASTNPNDQLKLVKLSSLRVFGTFVYPNSLGGFLLVLLPICLGILLSVRTPFARILSAIALALAIAALLLTRSKACIGLAGIGVIAMFLMALRAGRISKRSALSVSLVALIAAGSMLAWGYGGGLAARLQATGGARMDYWRAAAKMIAKEPIKGWGSGAYGRNYRMYAPKNAESTKLAHNIFLNVWVDYGLLGVTGCLMALGIPMLVGLRRALRRDQFDWFIASCAIAGVCFFLHHLVDFDFHVIGIVLPGLFALSVAQMSAQES